MSLLLRSELCYQEASTLENDYVKNEIVGRMRLEGLPEWKCTLPIKLYSSQRRLRE